MSNISYITKEKLRNSGADKSQAEQILEILNKHQENPEACWKALSRDVLTPDLPDDLHQNLFRGVYRQDDKFSDAPPAWFPDDQNRNTNLHRLLDRLNLDTYEALHRFSVTQKAEFWKTMADMLYISFHHPAKETLKINHGPEHAQWFKGARMNIAESCFQATPEKPAITYGDESGKLNHLSYGELRDLAGKIANGLKASGFQKGDKAAVDMPMTAEAVAIYLGIIFAGGAVVSIADSLAADEVKKRLQIAEAKWLFTQDVILRGNKKIPLYEKLPAIPEMTTIVLPAETHVSVSLRNGDISWENFLSGNSGFEPVSMSPEDHCNILFSSGTTGDPKAIPWSHIAPLKAAADGFAHQDIQPQDVVAWPTNLGWMMGPWLIFATFINRATMALFYGAPTGKPFGEFVQNAGITVLGVVPSMVKRWRTANSLEGLDWSKIKLFSSTGESSNPQDYLWLMARAGYKPVIEYCGGTEIGGGYLTGTMLQPTSPAGFTTPTLGLDLVLLDERNQRNDEGEVFLIPPSIGLSTTLLNKDHNKAYYDTPRPGNGWKSASGIPLHDQTGDEESYPVLREHGDTFRKLRNGFYRAQGRADDTMNLGGIKTSSVEIERLLDTLPEIRETAAIAAEPPGGGPNRLVVFYTPHAGKTPESDDLLKRFQKQISTHLNPLFKIHEIISKPDLPRTASNKVMRRILRQEYKQVKRI